jgi:hypothetical protein
VSSNINTRKFRWFGGAAIGALALATLAVPLTPAHAQIGVQIGPYGVDVGGPYYGPGPYYYGYGPHYYHHYYGPGYYGW